MVDYRCFEMEDHPFAMEGLCVREILSLYRGCRDRRHQIKILAELCGTDVKKMKKFLTAWGCELPAVRAAYQGGPDLETRLKGDVEPTLAYIREEIEKGHSLSRICRHLHETPESVKKLAGKHGIVFPLAPAERAMKHKEGVEKGRELAAKGMTASEAALILGVVASTAREWAIEGGYHYAKPPRRNARHG